MKLSLLLVFRFAALPLYFYSPTAYATSESLQIETRVDESTLASQVPNPEIGAFDLSPDGKVLALFVLSGDPIQRAVPEWLMIVNTADSKILKKSQIGTSPKFVQGYAPQIEFAKNGKLLLVEDGANVTVLDAATLEKLRRIEPSSKSQFTSPVSILAAASSPIAAITFGAGDPVKKELEQRPVRIKFVDLEKNKNLAEWNAPDLPMSISPDGALVAISDHSSPGATMPVDICEAQSGKKVATLSGGFGFEKPEANAVPIGRVIATFVTQNRILLTPDASSDRSGHYAGDSLKILKLPGSNTLQIIKPENYGPTGRMAVSADQNTIVVVSQYIPPRYQTHDGRLPSVSAPQLMVFSKKDKFVLSALIKLPALPALRIQPALHLSSIRLSADGSLIAIAEKYGITVYAPKQ